MKKIVYISILLCLLTGLKAQIAISKSNVTNTSVSLEFGENENKGIILPYVTDKSGITENGTIIYDATDFKLKYLKDTNIWFDLTVDTTGSAGLDIQGNDKEEFPGAKICISPSAGGTDTTKGILVLADDDKAMILPRVASPHLNIINPDAGMMVYDTVKRQLAVYNGKVWTFWKP
ncbi:hypothetical protein [Chryseobacterium lathyri]|uniref:Uncharacterized protein n=1 Tax=Chryseobacterium lathyri TaxID=395933 RepID=A0ABT9SS52_9FLAO|nr:hypothetical protein [Chryseobacterium lathyri]MDP9962286.1 hypothetical protein [Chryseobacterium lathyri]MDQ0067173.1 hypothetical protein [Chryseobacterium lathyri]